VDFTGLHTKIDPVENFHIFDPRVQILYLEHPMSPILPPDSVPGIGENRSGEIMK
jgi:hypothetical protein